MSLMDIQTAIEFANLCRMAYGIVPSSIGTESTVIDDSCFATPFHGGTAIIFRGTMAPEIADERTMNLIADDWLNDAQCLLRTVPYSGGRVHTGFAHSLNNLWPFIQDQKLLGDVWFAGHSKGAALATLATKRLAFETWGQTESPTIKAVHCFGGPRIGDETWANEYKHVTWDHWRVEHRNDMICHVPPTPALMIALRRDETIANIFAEIDQYVNYQHVTQGLQFLDWFGGLQTNDTDRLWAEREGALLFSGPIGIEDHLMPNYIAALQGLI